jgi:hypothetical protein
MTGFPHIKPGRWTSSEDRARCIDADCKWTVHGTARVVTRKSVQHVHGTGHTVAQYRNQTRLTWPSR